MLRYVVRRLLLVIPILLGVSILIFFWVHRLPGGPAEALLGERATPQLVREYNQRYGLDKPLPVQYWSYLKATLSGDLGVSVATHRKVVDEIRQRFPATIELAVAAMIFAITFGIPLGFFAAKTLRRLLRPRDVDRVVTRDLDPDLLPCDHPQVLLLGEVAAVTQRGP